MGVAALVLSAALSISLGGGGASAVPRSFYGVMPQKPLTTADFDQMEQARVGTLRFQISWAADPSPAPGDTNWSSADAVMTQLAEGGIKPLPFVYSTPQWAAKLDGHNCSGAQCAAFAPRTAASRSAFKQFLVELMERYGRGGSFWAEHPNLRPQPIRTLQILNEQNSPTFYKPKPNVKDYAKLLKASHNAVRGVDPNAEIVLGGMFGTPLGGRKPGITAWDYLERLYEIKGAKRSFEGVAPHPYAARMKKVLAQLDLFREAMRKGGDSKADLWITEIGWGSSGPDNPLVRGARGQASRLKQAFGYFGRHRGRLHIRSVIWYSWRDSAGGGLCEWCPGSGLLTDGSSKKPSYKAFVGFTGGS